jgi:hypothetical protein
MKFQGTVGAVTCYLLNRHQMLVNPLQLVMLMDDGLEVTDDDSLPCSLVSDITRRSVVIANSARTKQIHQSFLNYLI